jgi:N6-L-threonylcarbamoyladenine synthase
MPDKPVILGIETSCDDTAAAVVKGDRLASNIISSQLAHTTYGGVVPEIASRAHQQLIVPVVERALEEAGVGREDLDAVAVTYGPGLAGSLLVGLSFAKALAFGLDVPLVGVNHLEGHIYSVKIDPPGPPFPYLCLVVSGGHTEIVHVEEGFQHRVLGKTRDDAAGEAFDKVAKMLDLGYPGGPRIEKLARNGDPNFHRFPRSRPGGLDFSFSGIKTSVLYYLNKFSEEERAKLLEDHLADVCASFQQAIIDVLIEVLVQAAFETQVGHVAIVGGVSANTALLEAARKTGRQHGFEVHAPALAYSMDNAAMIAVTARYKLAAGITSPLTLTAVPALTVV